MILYGISNCDTVRKARAWLSEHDLDYRYHDFRKDGLDIDMLQDWSDIAGWETLLNKRGTTWRSLSVTDQADMDADKALNLMLKHLALIKRPILVTENKVQIGFKSEIYEKLIG